MIRKFVYSYIYCLSTFFLFKLSVTMYACIKKSVHVYIYINNMRIANMFEKQIIKDDSSLFDILVYVFSSIHSLSQVPTHSLTHSLLHTHTHHIHTSIVIYISIDVYTEVELAIIPNRIIYPILYSTKYHCIQ